MMERLTMQKGLCSMVSTDYCHQSRDCYECGHGREVFRKLSGYEDAEEQGRLMEFPCKIGDEVWGIRCYRGVKRPQKGRVSEMYYRQDMSLLISVKHICRGLWGKTVFPTYEAAEASLKGGKRE